MNTQITQHITKENASAVIARFSGWKVDTLLAEIIFKNMFEGKEFPVRNVSEVCDFYASALWNNGAISK